LLRRLAWLLSAAILSTAYAVAAYPANSPTAATAAPATVSITSLALPADPVPDETALAHTQAAARQLARLQIQRALELKARQQTARLETVIAYALAQVGKPYVFAAAGPNAFDCSGLVMAAFARIGIRLPHFTGTMIRYGSPVSRSALRRGDMVFPTSGHVAIYLGGGRIVEAANPRVDIRVSTLTSFYAARRLA
jgi:cell wall-associated NlpC family hydrolase